VKALLHVQVVEKPEEVLFQTTYEMLIKRQFPEIPYFSLDNFSDVSMIDYALKLIQRSEKILIVIESKHEEADPNKLLKLLNHLVRRGTSNVKLVMLGEHPTVEKMAKALGNNFEPRPKEEKLLRIAENLFS
jgi:hypothetical protein